jgi:hypothetical protein
LSVLWNKDIKNIWMRKLFQSRKITVTEKYTETNIVPIEITELMKNGCENTSR